MKTNGKSIIAGAAIALASSIVFSSALAETPAAAGASETPSGHAGKNAPKARPLKGIIDGHVAKMRSYLEGKKKERQEFRESLKGKSSEEQKTLIDQFRAKQVSEIKAFAASTRDETVSKIQGSDVPEEVKTKAIAKLRERWSEVDARMKQQMAENKQELDQAFSDGKISTEEREKFRELRKKHHKENKDFRDSRQPNKKSDAARDE